MSKTHSLISDSELDVELLQDLKHRKIDQKHFYTDKKPADLYYQNIKIPRPYLDDYKNNLSEEDLIAFCEKNILNKKETSVIVSLGCGKANIEKNILKNVYKDGYKFHFIGVDSSRYMLELADDYLSDCLFEKEFVCADFGSPNFPYEISYIIEGYKHKIFAFLGGTVGNITSSIISDILVNMMKKGDLLWMSAYLRSGQSKEDDFRLFNRFVGYRNEPNVVTRFFYPLERMGVPFKNGRMTLDMEEEKSIGSLQFTFSFDFIKKSVIKFRGEAITILPGEKIELFTMRTYDKKTFEHFFVEHGFKLLNSEAKGNIGQFLFKKK